MKKILISKTLILIFAFQLSFSTVSAQELQIGDKAPLFQAVDENGKDWNLADKLGEKTLVLYFYPAAMTSGCTKQACAYRDYKSNLDNLDVEVIGISGDNYKNLSVFKETHNLNFKLLSDYNGTIAKKYHVPVKKGGTIKKTENNKEFSLKRGVTTMRWTFIIDKDGKIAYIDKHVNPTQDTKNIIEFISSMN